MLRARLEIDDAARAAVLAGERDVAVDRDAAGVRERVELAAVGEAVAGVGERADAGRVDHRARLEEDVLRRRRVGSSRRSRRRRRCCRRCRWCRSWSSEIRPPPMMKPFGFTKSPRAFSLPVAVRVMLPAFTTRMKPSPSSGRCFSKLSARPPRSNSQPPAVTSIDGGDPDQRRAAGAGRAEHVRRVGRRVADRSVAVDARTRAGGAEQRTEDGDDDQHGRRTSPRARCS